MAGATKKKKLRRQMEFYFSDANLRHDTYLKSLITPDGWCSLAEILNTFQKAVKLVDGIEDRIAFATAALKDSDVVFVQGDRVRRKHPMSLGDPTLHLRTACVLNARDDLDALRRRYEKIGPVDIVRFNKEKSVAFVEFAHVDDAKKACSQYEDLVTHAEWNDTSTRWNILLTMNRKSHQEAAVTTERPDLTHSRTKKRALSCDVTTTTPSEKKKKCEQKQQDSSLRA